MVFNTGAALLDAIVLAVVSHESEGTYGYKITQDVRSAINVSGVYVVSGVETTAERRMSGSI